MVRSSASEKTRGPKTEFLGRQPDSRVSHYASRCRALLFTGEEDFGMVPLEVNAAGRPVIAFRGGGAMETVIEGVTGIFLTNRPGPLWRMRLRSLRVACGTS